VEAVSALQRRRNLTELTAKEHERIEGRIDRDRAHWEVLDVDEQVIGRAKAVIRETSVRTLDAIHLASALGIQGYSRRRIPFVTGDEYQRAAAAVLGLEIVWVG
jgi:predicted nucleic acid-binding protein